MREIVRGTGIPHMHKCINGYHIMYNICNNNITHNPANL